MAGNATSQLLSHAIIQETTKTSLSPIALYVAIPETRHDIKRDKIKLNRTDAKRAGIMDSPSMG
jgi:hypothetical protein